MEHRPPYRLRIAMGCGLAVLLSFLGILWRLQVVEGADYYARSQRSVAQVESVPAARGRIVDRAGRVLARDGVVWQLTLPLDGLTTEDTLALMDLCRQEGLGWTDTLPVEGGEPFALLEGGQSRLAALLAGWEEEMPPTGVELLSLLAKRWALPATLTPQELRDLAGVTYELALRREGVTQGGYTFLEDAPTALIAQIKELSLTGVGVAMAARRQYETTAAAHLLGRVAPMDEEDWETYRPLGYRLDELVGKEGVEGVLEAALHGTRGSLVRELDRAGALMGAGYAQKPQPGCDGVLTLDLSLQEKVEEVLAAQVPLLAGAQGAAAVVLDVSDGGTLALASYPTYDLAAFSQQYTQLAADPLRPLYNRAIQGLYAPGSVFKMVTATAALEEGIITPATQILDTGRYTYYQSPQPQCWIYRQRGRTHGLETVTEAITDSCNVFFYDAGRRVGIDKLGDYARRFGLGEATGIELAGESTGVVAGPAYTQSLGETWYAGSTLSAAIGQENNRFTPLQLASYAATLASGGKRWQVHLIDRVVDHQGEELYRHTPTLLDDLNLSESTTAVIRAGMEKVTQEGALAAVFNQVGVPVCGKTGSAQVTGSQEANAVFLAFAPADAPEVALALVVEKGASGAQLASIAAQILAHLYPAK